MRDRLISKLKNKSAVIGVFGLGYIGLPLLLRYAEVGYKVFGFEIDQEKINMLKQGKSYIDHITSDQIHSSVSKDFNVTTNYSRASEVDALILCLPTPLNKHREPDLSYLTNTVDKLIPYLRKGHIISLESTTYPGTTEEVILPRVELTGLKIGKDVFLVYSPEREDPANSDFTTQSIPKVVSGHTSACLEIGKTLYQLVIDQIVPVSSTRTAEMTKLLENIFRAVNIGLVNEMKIVADRMEIDIHEVIRAAATKPFGFTPYYPGPGLGGHCIPIDPFYLTWKAREYDVNTRFIELAGEVNTKMPNWVLSKIVWALNERKKSLKGSKVLILGVAYKKNIGDMRESPAIVLIKLLKEMGATVEYTDPHVPVFPDLQKHNFKIESVDPTPEDVAKYDLLLLVTDHKKFDYQMFKKNAQLIVDTRGVFQDLSMNVVKA